MHAEALAYVNRFASDDALSVVEFGSRDINGSPRPLFPHATWWGIDITDGPAVDEVADATVWVSPEPVDMVICTEVFEHFDGWDQIVANMAANLKPGGRALITAACLGRAPHSAVDGGQLRDGEYYANVNPETLRMVLKGAGFTAIEVEDDGADVYATAVKDTKKVTK